MTNPVRLTYKHSMNTKPSNSAGRRAIIDLGFA
jgi:hypothetical protein